MTKGQLRLHWLQHVPFEGLGHIEHWASRHDYRCSATRLYDNERLPEVEPIDLVVIMGGPMNIYQDDIFPWLTAEKLFIEKAIGMGKPIVGICLGAQLIADVLGARIYKGEYAEIGWHKVDLTPNASGADSFRSFPLSFTPFHWHGDTFDLPENSIHLASSAGCRNQAFEYDKRIVGLQFHLESTRDAVEALITHCGTEIVPGKYIQNADDIRMMNKGIATANGLMDCLLDNVTALED